MAQLLLALHTIIGGVWKFSNPEQTVPALSAIPHGVWLAMGVVELLTSVGLILPAFSKRLARLAPIAAGYVAAEMFLFTALHLYSGRGESGQIVYWLIVAALCAFIGASTLVREPRFPG